MGKSAQGVFRVCLGCLGGTKAMLSVDQFLRLITVPAVVVAFLIASQVSGAGILQTASLHNSRVQAANQ